MRSFDLGRRTIGTVAVTLFSIFLISQLTAVGYGLIVTNGSPFDNSVFLAVQSRIRSPFVERVFSPAGVVVSVLGFYTSLAYFLRAHHRRVYGDLRD